MLSDAEILHLQRSIAFHRSRQAEEINSRDVIIASLRSENKNLNSIIIKHQEQYGIIKEKLVKAMIEFEMRGTLLDTEKAKNVANSATLDQRDNALELARQDKDFVRRQLAEAEGLIAQNSQQRGRALELETSLQHAREQIRLLTDNKSSMDSQLQSRNRDLEESKFKTASAEMRIELMMKEKNSLVEELFELKQHMAKNQIGCNEELSEAKRELLKAKDLAESERVLRIKVESTAESVRAKEMEEYRLKIDAQQREIEARKSGDHLEKEVEKLSVQLETVKEALNGKEMELSLECKRSRALDAQMAKLQLQADVSNRSTEEAKGQYEAMRIECKYARQKVLESVGFVIDILTISSTDTNEEQMQDATTHTLKQTQNESASNAHQFDSNRVKKLGVIMDRTQKSLLMLSPRAKRSFRTQNPSALTPTDSSISLPHFCLFLDGNSDEMISHNVAQVGNEVHDPFDLPSLHGLSDALCLPDLRSVLQTLRDQIERIQAERNTVLPQYPCQNPVDDESENSSNVKDRNTKLLKVRAELDDAENTIKHLHRDLAGHKTTIDDLNMTINRMERDRQFTEMKGREFSRSFGDRNRIDSRESEKLNLSLQSELRSSHAFVGRSRENIMAQSLKDRQWDSVLFEDDMRMSQSLGKQKEREREREREREKEIENLRDDIRLNNSVLNCSVLRESELKRSIVSQNDKHESERLSLLAEVEMLKSRVATLISQNKDCNAYFSLVVPVLPIADSNLDGENVQKSTGCTDNDEHSRMDINPIAYALVSERANSASLSLQLDTAKMEIQRLNADIAAAAGLCGDLDQANETIAKLSSQVLAARAKKMSGEALSEGSPAVSAHLQEEVKTLRSKLKWTCKHHTVMCRAILQLERDLKLLGDENSAKAVQRDDSVLDHDSSLGGSRGVRNKSPGVLVTAMRCSREGLDRTSTDRDDRMLSNPDDRLLSKSQDRLLSRYTPHEEKEKEMDKESETFQAVQKLKIRSLVRGRIVGIYRKCLFALKDKKLPGLPEFDRTGRGRGFESDRVGEQEEGEYVEGDEEGEENGAYDHDRDYDLLSLSCNDMQLSRIDRNVLRGSQSEGVGVGSEVGFPGPKVCLWLDNELGALRGAYEGEVRTLEEIIATLRTTLKDKEKEIEKKKIKKRTKNSLQKSVESWRQPDDFVVRHVDDEISPYPYPYSAFQSPRDSYNK